MAQVSENRIELRDAVMHDDIIRKEADYLGEKNVRSRMWKTHNKQGSDKYDGLRAGTSHPFGFSTSIKVFIHYFQSTVFS